MTSPADTLGARLAAAAPAGRFALHQAASPAEAWADYHRTAGAVFDRALRGARVLEVRRARRKVDADEIALLDVAGEDREVLDRALAPAAHEPRGAWYLPKDDKPAAGLIQLAWWAAREPRYALSAADTERAFIVLDTADEMLVWGFLQPLFDVLILPLKQRSSTWLGDRRPELMAKDWARVDEVYEALGIDPAVLAVYKDGPGWADLPTDQVIAARQALLDAWAAAPDDVGARAVVWHIDQLVARYYTKAKDGRAERTKVLNKGLERSLTAAFGGDWLSLVGYLGEQIHPAEQISAAVPETTILATGRDRTAQAAAATGIPAEQIERVLAAYWDGARQSPVDERIAVIERWWAAFDDLHARQAPGMQSLWGLLGDRWTPRARPGGGDDDSDDGDAYAPGRYRDVGEPLCTDIERLWGTTVLARWPDRLVTEPYPHAAFAETLGPAVDFWHGIALTCWFICEGPYSRTDIPGAPSYYQSQLKELEDTGCAVDSALFADLREAERKLVDRPIKWKNETVHEIADGVSVTMRFDGGTQKKDGFEHLRDVVTRHRRAWAAQHLNGYLRSLWTNELRGVGNTYHRQTADKGKPPTAKQFAKMADKAAAHWFGGDLTKVCDALGLPADDPPRYERRLPASRDAFLAHLAGRMGAQDWYAQSNDLPEDERTRRLRRWELLQRAPEVVQIWEATEDLPPLKGNSWANYLLDEAYAPDREAGWAAFVADVAAATSDSANDPPPEHADTTRHEPPTAATPAPTSPSRVLPPPPVSPGPIDDGAREADKPQRGWRRFFRS